MKLLFICFNLLIFLFSSAVFFEIEAKKRRGRKRPPPLVSVSKVIKREVRNRLNSIGTANPYRKSIVSSQIEGRVRTFPVFQGTYVEAGKSIIATLFILYFSTTVPAGRFLTFSIHVPLP